ncbi:MAG: DUF1254 domain-containing protein [Deltaproteobacteria bacterium]|nr:DUF1254 domain-containing protein [Deltaproteobacteria bacterium]
MLVTYGGKFGGYALFVQNGKPTFVYNWGDTARYTVTSGAGTRTLGEKGGNFAIVGPKWQGKLPAGLKKIQAPTNTVWIIGRILTRGKADYKAVHAIQDQCTLTPLSVWEKKSPSRPAPPVDPQVDMKAPPMHQVADMKAGVFFQNLAAAMKANPPASADAPALKKFAALGIIPGKDFNLKKLPPATAQALEAGVQLGQMRILGQAEKIGEVKNGWQIMRSPIGTYGANYDIRAAIAYFGLGANLMEDAVYPSSFKDQEGQTLTGKQRYVLHFDKDKLPPVNAFWSLTMYGENSFLAPNPLGRYALGDRDSLKYNPDGSLDLYLQNQSPGPDKEANWLPAPADEFNVTLRLYWPKKEVLEGAWNPLPIRRVK